MQEVIMFTTEVDYVYAYETPFGWFDVDIHAEAEGVDEIKTKVTGVSVYYISLTNYQATGEDRTFLYHTHDVEGFKDRIYYRLKDEDEAYAKEFEDAFDAAEDRAYNALADIIASMTEYEIEEELKAQRFGI